MRIGQVNQENYKDFLKILGVKNPKGLEKLNGEGEDGGKTKGKGKASDNEDWRNYCMSFEARKQRLLATGIGTEGMIIEGNDESWKKIVPVSDSVKQKVIDHVRDIFVTNGNGTVTEKQGNDFGDVVHDYITSLPPSERLSAYWTLQKIYQAEAGRINDYVRSQVPGWTNGQKFDTSILTKSNFGLNHMDIKA